MSGAGCWSVAGICLAPIVVLAVVAAISYLTLES